MKFINLQSILSTRMGKYKIFIFSLLILIPFGSPVHAQEWEFVKEKDGIKVYTREEPGSGYKAYKGEVEMNATMLQVCPILEDVEQFDDWDEDVSEIRLLSNEPGKYFKYYVVYDTPWPFTDRDLCIEATITDDPLTGIRLIDARPIPDAVPLDPDLVRITHYWQKWIVEPEPGGKVHLIIEGFADPAGDVPAWMANMAITNTPLNTLGAIRENVK
jgi:hypothetical protein